MWVLFTRNVDYGQGVVGQRIPSPTEFEVRKAIAGNLCRCTGYVRIVKAILKASQASTVGTPRVGRE